MADFKLKRGYDIPIEGRAEKKLTVLPPPKKAALLAQEFRGLKLKLLISEGDKVKIGTALLADKSNPDIKLVSPVSGTVSEIVRGERRILKEIVVENDGKNAAEIIGKWKAEEAKKMDDRAIKTHLLAGGMWPHIRQRPFNKVANPADTPRDIFISAFDTSPLAADPAFMLEGEEEAFQLGLEILGKLSGGKVHLSMNSAVQPQPAVFANARGVEKHFFSGPHPAGNVGVQIHHVAPLQKDDLVWVVQPFAVALIGKFFLNGFFQNERVVALAGGSLEERSYVKTIQGAPISELIPEKNIIDENVRFIAGNVFTGSKTTYKGYLTFYDHLVTVIPEAKKERKLLGYFRPGLNLPSFSKTFLSALIPGKKFKMDTSLYGSHRAFILNEEYERVLPMDIMPVQLMKSILAEDFEEMENLGILELDEEDVALCSYIDLSKNDFGAILRSGLDLIEREG